MDTILNGFNRQSATFKKLSSDMKIGEPVLLSANGNASRAINGDQFMGVCVGLNEKFASVAFCGEVKSSYTGTTTPTMGWNQLVADGCYGVKVSDDAVKSYLVVGVDTVNKIISYLL